MNKLALSEQLATSLAICLATHAVEARAQEPTAPPAAAAVNCSESACTSTAGILMQIRTRGERQPVTVSAPETSAALRPDRRVTIEQEGVSAAPSLLPGRAQAMGTWTVQLPDGGVVWAVEDPNLGQPVMSVSAPSLAAFDGARISKPITFHVYNNYSAFTDRAAVLVYRASDVDRVRPLATIPLKLNAVTEVAWDGALSSTAGLRAGDRLIYVVRAWDREGKNFDETAAREMQLATPEEEARGASILRRSAEQAQGPISSTDEAVDQTLAASVFGENNLARQNISIHGSRIRIQGRNLPEGYSLKINGADYPIDPERKMVAEYIVPVGRQAFDLELTGDGPAIRQALDVDVTGRYLFMVGIADVSISQNNVSGSMEPLSSDDAFQKDILVDGRLAFYLKGKIKGRYLITAQADTRETEIGDMFKDLITADPQDVFRRLDPDLYYPVYGDDSTTYRDVDTQGRLYVRVDWDKNQALFGNFNTGITGTEYAQYSRALYGGAFSLRSQRSTATGEARSELRAFASENSTAPGHSEFLGTGGSLYYLKHTDLLPGSDRIVLEIRDPLTGRTESRRNLVRGMDYEIDELQGRLILTKPLAQTTRENVPSIIRDRPLDGFNQVLLVDYEYVPTGLDLGNTTIGARGKHWFGDHIGLGATYVEESRSGEDYVLKGVDLTLRAGLGTFLKIEHAETNAASAPVFFSDNGGLSFSRINSLIGERSGEANSVEAAVNFNELGWAKRDWSAAAWWRDVSDGFSIARADRSVEINEYGAELRGQINDAFKLYARLSHAERDKEQLDQAQVSLDWLITEKSQLTAELRYVDEDSRIGQASATLAAVQYSRWVGANLQVYGSGQAVLDGSGRYADNNAVTAGARYNFGDIASISAEGTHGDRGDGAQIQGEYQTAPGHTIYANYSQSTDQTGYDPLAYNSRNLSNGWTLGQRWRLSDQVNMYNESQFLKAPNESGLAHTFGMDFYPAVGWRLGGTLQVAELHRFRDSADFNLVGDSFGGVEVEVVDRNVLSASLGRSSPRMEWSSKLEWRRDTGAERREQWVTTNHLQHRVSESLRLAAKLNYSKTTDELTPSAGAKFIEGSVGFALRPWNSTRTTLLGKYTYLYDLSSLAQIGDQTAFYDQKSQIFSLEGVYKLDQHWEFAGKAAQRNGSVRFGRLEGQWADSGTSFLGGQVRYGFADKWHGVAEYRWLSVDDGGAKQGFLIAIDRDITSNVRVGAGYNFTDFSDDLTDFDYDHNGWFLNIVAVY